MKTKTIEIILKGLLAQDQDLFIKRLSNILNSSKDDIVDSLVNGVIVEASILDETLVKAELTRRFDSHDWKRCAVTVEDYNTILITGVYSKTVYCKTQEDADRVATDRYIDRKSSANDVYTIPAVIEEESYFRTSSENASKYGITLVLN